MDIMDVSVFFDTGMWDTDGRKIDPEWSIELRLYGGYHDYSDALFNFLKLKTRNIPVEMYHLNRAEMNYKLKR